MSGLASLRAADARCLGLIAVLIFAPSLFARADTDDFSRILSARVTAGVWFSSVDGYLQTPAGGGAGTTSTRRPTFSQIGISGHEAGPSVDAELLLFEDHSFHYNYFSSDQSGRTTLDKDLTSQGHFFPAGSHVTSDYDADLMRLGYRARWLDVLGLLDSGDWKLLPEIGYAVFDFHYQLDSAGIVPVDRKYDVEFPFIAILLEGPIYTRFEGAQSVAFETEIAAMGWVNGVSYIDADIRLALTFAQVWRTRWAIVSGVRGVWMKRKDDQSPMKNDVNTRYGAFSGNPWSGVHVGLRVEFP